MHKNWRGFPTTGCKPVGYENSGADAGQVRLLPKPPYSFTRSCESRHILRAITLMDQLLSARMTGTARWIYQGAVLLCLAGRRGFEPRLRSSKPRVLPLDDLPKSAGKKAAIIDMDSEQGTAKKWGARRNGLDSPTVRTADIIGLPKVLSELEAEGYDWAFLDLPGRSAPISGAGLAASDMVIIPCRPLDVDIEASITTVRDIITMLVSTHGRRYRLPPHSQRFWIVL
jgi:hypothetical protein